MSILHSFVRYAVDIECVKILIIVTSSFSKDAKRENVQEYEGKTEFESITKQSTPQASLGSV